MELIVSMLIALVAGYAVTDMVLRYIRAQERIATALENMNLTMDDLKW